MTSILEVGLSNAVAAAVVAMLAGLAGLVCRFKLPALVHALWLLVLLKLITPPLFLVPIPWPAPSPPAPAPLAEKAEAQPAEVWEGLEIPDEWALGEEQPGLALGEEPQGEEEAVALSEPPPGREAHAPAGFSVPWREVGGGVWLAGSLGWFSLAAWRIAKFRRGLRFAQPADLELQERTAWLAGQVGLGSCPEVRLWPARLAPLVWWTGGRPLLLLPAALAERLNPAALDTLLLHELAHLRRRDHWVRLLELVVLGLYWWHPVVWYARRALREAEEECCDAWVVSAAPGSARLYATALVDTLDFLAGAAPAPLAASGIGPVSDLKRRLTMILRGSTPRALSWPACLAVLALAALLLPLMPGRLPADPTEDKKDVIIRKAANDALELAVQLGGQKAPREDPKAGAEEQKLQAEIEKLRAELEKKVAELHSAKKKQEEAARARQLDAARRALEGVKEARRVTEVTRGGPTIRIEISGLDLKGDQLADLVKRLEKELPGKEKRILLVAPAGGVRVVPPGTMPLAPMPVVPPPVRLEVKPGLPPAGGDRRMEGLEKKLDGVLKELEELRRELKERRPGTGRPAAPGVAPTPAVPATPPAGVEVAPGAAPGGGSFRLLFPGSGGSATPPASPGK